MQNHSLGLPRTRNISLPLPIGVTEILPPVMSITNTEVQQSLTLCLNRSFPLQICCCFRKDSRLYSYLPVVGMTLKLYNLLPHPTAQPSSELMENVSTS